MADKNEEVLDKKIAKKLEKAKKKEEKLRAKAAKVSDELEEEEESSGSKIAVFFVTIIIVLIWLAIIVLLVKWDVGGFGSTVLSPVLKDVPVINRILPETDEIPSSTEAVSAYGSMDDALAKIKELEIQLSEAQDATVSGADQIAQLEAQAKELEKYKQDEAAFEKEKQEFYNEVVFGDEAPDIDEYKKYYESIDPANAEALYRQVVEQSAADAKIEDYVKTYASMKPKEAAAIFDTMTNNLKLVANILEHMDTQSRADILGKMNADTAAKVTEIMKPSE